MQQEDRIVHRAGELQHRADRVGQERDFPENDVRPHIDDDGDTEYGKKQHRLKPGGGCDRQDEENNNDSQHHHAGDLCIDRRAEVGIRYCGSGDQTAVTDDLFDLADGCMRAAGRVLFEEDDIHIGVAVFIVILDIAVIDELARTVDVGRGITPHHHVHAVHICDAVFYVFRLIQCHILQHDTSHAGISKLGFHNIKRLRGRSRIRQVLCQIIVDADHRNADQAEDQQDSEKFFDPLPVVYDQINRTVSV